VPVAALTFDDKEEHIAVGFVDGSVDLWHLEAQTKVVLERGQYPASALCFLPSLGLEAVPPIIALWRGKNIEVWNGIQKTLLKSFTCTQPQAEAAKKKYLQFTPCGTWLIATYDCYINIWETTTAELYEVDLKDNWAALTFHPEKPILTVATETGQVHHHDLLTKTTDRSCLFTKGSELSRLFYSMDGTLCGVFIDGVRVLKTVNQNAKSVGSCSVTANWGDVTDAAILQENEGTAYLITCKTYSKHLRTWFVNLQRLEYSAPPQETTPLGACDDPDLKLADQLIKESTVRNSSLVTDIANLKQVKSVLHKGKIAAAMDQLAAINRPSLAHAVLNRGLLKLDEDDKLSSFLTLNDLKAIVPRLKDLLTSDQKEHIELSLICLREIVRCFTPAIKSQGGTLRESFLSVRRSCMQLTSTGGNVTTHARELSAQIQAVI